MNFKDGEPNQNLEPIKFNQPIEVLKVPSLTDSSPNSVELLVKSPSTGLEFLCRSELLGHFQLPPSLGQNAGVTWSNKHNEAVIKGSILTNGTGIRLLTPSIDPSQSKIIARTQLTSYKDFLGSSKKDVIESLGYSRDQISNFLGACVVLLTADNQILVTLRTAANAVYGAEGNETDIRQIPHHALGTMLKPDSLNDQNRYDPKIQLTAEIKHEAQIPPEEIERLEFIGMAYDPHVLHPEFMYLARINESADTIISRHIEFQKKVADIKGYLAQKPREISLIAVPLSQLESYIEKPNNWVPTGWLNYHQAARHLGLNV
jgi:hypothetical protein